MTDQRVSWSIPLASSPSVLRVKLFSDREEVRLWWQGLCADPWGRNKFTGSYSSVNVDVTFILRGALSLKSHSVGGLGGSHLYLQAALQPFCQALLLHSQGAGQGLRDLCHFLTKRDLLFTIKLRLDFMGSVGRDLKQLHIIKLPFERWNKHMDRGQTLSKHKTLIHICSSQSAKPQSHQYLITDSASNICPASHLGPNRDSQLCPKPIP